MLECRTGRVVRRTQHDRLCGRCNRSPHGIKIMNSAPTQRHRHLSCTCHRYRDRIRLKAAPCEDHFVASLTGGLKQVIEHRHRAGPKSELFAGHTKPDAQRIGHLSIRDVGVAVHPAYRSHRGLNDTRKRREGIFVTGQLERGGLNQPRSRFAGRIDRQTPDSRPQFDQIRTSPRGVLKIAAARPVRSRG
jgi:hypothetical protein